MKIFSEVIGNMTTDPQWAEKLKNTKIEYLELDQWTAQKSRFIAKGSDGQEYAVALKRHSQIENGVSSCMPENSSLIRCICLGYFSSKLTYSFPPFKYVHISEALTEVII